MLILLLLPLFIYSNNSNNLTAKEIIDKSLEHKTFSYDNSEANITMILVDKNNNKDIRKVKIRSKTKNDLTKTISVFSGGTEVNGVKFLTLEVKDGDDEQYVYYPAQNKINRIVSKSNKNEYFLGTDFTYSDLEGKYRKDASYKKLQDEKVGKHDSFVIEATPKKDSSYSKTIIYIRKSDFIPLKVKFYDKDGKYFKQYTVKKIKKIDGRKVISISKILNKKSKHATILKLNNLNFKAEISDSEFNKENLR
jgi:outer membrane lipoprotein-sorting protein